MNTICLRWNKCVAKASSDSTGFGMAVGHKYVIANFPETAKEDVSDTQFITHFEGSTTNMLMVAFTRLGEPPR